MSDNENKNTELEKNEVEAPGWDAITEVFEKAYPGQTEPKHYASIIKWRFGGDSPLDGISIYETDEYYHFVTYGLSELYEKETDDPEWSGYGMEFTMRLKRSCIDPDGEENELRNVCGIFQQIAGITFKNRELFLPNEYIYNGQTVGFDCKHRSNLTGFILVADEVVPAINTPFGKVEFVEFVGCTDAELLMLKNSKLTVQEMYSKLGTDITDYNRDSVV